MSSVGKQYRYVARAGRAELGGTGRYGQVVTVVWWKRTRALVSFPDGWLAVVPGRCLRKV